jgi:FKBP-type peptidyl-prolyl cis-trans isomerase FklB
MLGMILATPVFGAGPETAPPDGKAKESYSLGYEFGANLKDAEVGIDTDVLFASIRDGLDGKAPSLGPEQIHDTLSRLRKRVTELRERRYLEMAAKNLEEGRTFLEWNKAKEGVKTLTSGLQYKVLREGKGTAPKATDWATVQYRGTFPDGKEFDSSYARGEPASVPVNGMIKGWTEALQLMKTGSAWQLFVPADLAYGDRQFGRIPPNSALIFEVELLSASGGPPAAAAPSAGKGGQAP